MGPHSRTTLRALTEAVLPRSEEFYLPIEDEIVAGIDRLIACTPRHLQLGLSASLAILEICPFLAVGKPVRFSRLSLQDRQRVVRKGLESRTARVREITGILSGLVALLFYDDPRAMHHLGYHIEDHIQQVNADPPVPARSTVPLGRTGPPA